VHVGELDREVEEVVHSEHFGDGFGHGTTERPLLGKVKALPVTAKYPL
jgi:hypothetical protein